MNVTTEGQTKVPPLDSVYWLDNIEPSDPFGVSDA